MIAPRNKLLLWVGAGVVPAATLAGMVPETALYCVIVLIVLFTIFLVDAMLSPAELNALRVSVPDVIRLSTARSGIIPLTISRDDSKLRTLRYGLPLPPEVPAVEESAVTLLPGKSGGYRLDYACIPLRRGCYRLRRCYLEQNSRFGFWSVRRAVPIETELRVYPNLLTERKTVAALFLNRGRFGIHAQRQVGQGRDFEKLREYLPGDAIDEIHWKATAKRNKHVTKIFQIERTQEIYVIMDASRLCARHVASPVVNAATPTLPQIAMPGYQEAQKPTVLDRFITSALVLGMAAERQGDLFGLLAFSDTVQRFVRAKSGRQHFGALRDALYTLQPRLVNPDFDELCSFIRVRLRKRALLVFLTDLDDPLLAESFARNIHLIARQHLVVVNMLKPDGVAQVFSNENVGEIDDIYARLSGHLRWQDLQELDRVLGRGGARLSLVENEKLAASLISQYMAVKARQLI